MILPYAIVLNNFETVAWLPTRYLHIFSLRLSGSLILTEFFPLPVCRAPEILFSASFSHEVL